MSNTEKNVKTLAKRLWEFQCTDLELVKSKKGYGYNYTPLDAIIETIRPMLKNNGIGYIHQVNEEGDSKYITTKIFSSDDFKDSLECRSKINPLVKFKGMNEIQVEGAILTYYRRYHLSMLLGLTSEEDTDGAKSKKEDKSEDKGKQQNNWVAIFSNLLKSPQANAEQVKKSLESYKVKMSKEEYEQISSMIVDKFNNK